MKPRHCVVLTAIGYIVIAALATPAWAAGGGGGESGGGSLGPGGVSAGAGAPGADPTSYTVPSPNPPASTQSGYSWQDMGANNALMCLDNGQTIPNNGNPTPPPGTAVVGPNPYPDLYQLFGPNGPTGQTREVCPNATAPTPRPPPPPPTPAEVWADTPLPASHIHFNPSGLGLTQLPTWMWFTGPGGTVTATVNIRGYAVTTTAHPVAAYWWFGDGGSEQGPVGGSESQPSTTHTYVNVGHYVVTLIVAWSGQYTFVGNGVPAELVELGAVDGPATNAAYAVQEVRSVGVAPGSGQ